MSTPRAVSTAYLRGEGLDRLRGVLDLDVDPWLEHVPPRILSEEDLARRAGPDTAVLVVEAEMVGANVFEACPGLAVVGAARGDPWNVDVAAATAAGVLAIRTPGRNAAAVAELAVGLMIDAARGITAADGDVRAGRWVIAERIFQQRYRGPLLAGKTLGLLGYGAVGHEVAWRARGLGMRVVVYDPYAAAIDGVERADDLPALLRRSRFLSVHAAVTEETRGMIGAPELALLPEGAYLVNTAREAIVDRGALVAALRSGHLAGAALDHFQGEYLAPDDPLCTLPGVVLTAHIGGASVDADATHTTMLADDLEALLAGGVPRGALNPECANRARERLGA